MKKLLARFFPKRSVPSSLPPSVAALRLPCRADLWCRKRTSISTMLDPDLFALYMTGDDRIDEDWVVQSNPPCAFKAEFQDGCDALLTLLAEDPGLHATKGWLTFKPAEGSNQEACLERMKIVVRTAERELKLTA
jgi:hypothetical protein